MTTEHIEYVLPALVVCLGMMAIIGCLVLWREGN